MLLNPFFLEKAYHQTWKEVPGNLNLKMKKRRYNALKKAYLRLIENPYIDYESGEMLILSETVTGNGEAKFYRTSAKECRQDVPGNVLCHAFWDGYPCRHRATLEIIENYLLIETANSKNFSKTVDSVNSFNVAGVNS